MAWYTHPETETPDFSPTEAAFSGFRFIRRRPGVVAVWAGVFLLYELVVTLLLIALPGKTLQAVNTFGELNQSNPEAALKMLPGVSVVLLFHSIGYLALLAITYTASYRALLTPSHRSPGYLRLGVDEFYMGALIVVATALSAGYLFIVIFIGGLLAAIGSVLPPLMKALYFIAFGSALLFALVYPFVRLSLAMPMTFMDRHVRLIESWKHTRGEFWPLLGAYLLAGVMMFLVLLAIWAIVAVLALLIILATGGEFTSLSDLFRPDKTSLATYLTPTTLIAEVLNAIGSAVLLIGVSGPVAEAYRALGGRFREPSPVAAKKPAEAEA